MMKHTTYIERIAPMYFVCIFEGMTGSAQTEVLEKFRNGQYKVVVCTSVGTEGIDVPDCNIVINYNNSGNEITKLQMKGVC